MNLSLAWIIFRISGAAEASSPCSRQKAAMPATVLGFPRGAEHVLRRGTPRLHRERPLNPSWITRIACRRHDAGRVRSTLNMRFHRRFIRRFRASRGAHPGPGVRPTLGHSCEQLTGKSTYRVLCASAPGFSWPATDKGSPGYSFRGVRWMVSRRHPPSSNSTLTWISRRIFPFTQKDIVALSDDELVARMDHFPDICG